MNAQNENRTVVLVEDSDDDAFFFQHALGNAGTPARLIRLIDGGAAVEYLERAAAESKELSPSHLLFLDLKLPVLSGFDVLKWIRRRNLSIDVIVLSGSDLDSDMEAARQLGASDYLVKPISAMELGKRLASMRRPRFANSNEGA